MPPVGATTGSTALLVVDLQNAFCHPEGSFARMTVGRGLGTEMCRDAVGPCVTLVDAAHEAGVPVIYTRYTYHPGYVDGGVLLEKYPEMVDFGSLAAGSWDADLVADLPVGGTDVVVDKSRYSAFYGTRLEPVLTGLGARTLVVCGVTTAVCVESTVRDAAQRDYAVLVPAEATGELTRARHDAALEMLDYGFAKVVTVADVVGAWAVVERPG
jgi:ureidoacrylate peracid hydrolase